MPHITSAMRWSVRRGVGDIFFDSLLGKRVSISQEADNVKNTFSSWDNCMAKTYCKWPVIAAIIVGGLIVFSIVWCIIRCACCGMSCCCSCFSFLKCCDCCGGCCDGKKNKPHKYADSPFASAPPQQGYRAPPPMMGGGLANGPPQYAQFEVGKNGLAVSPAAPLNEDALPPMPSWETAAKKHVLTEEEKNAVELGELDPTTGQKIPLMAGGVGSGISAPPSPMNETGGGAYGAHQGQGIGGNGYMDVPGDQYTQSQNLQHQNGREYGLADQYAQNQSPYDQNGRSYGRDAPDQGRGGRGYDMNGPVEGAGRGYGPTSPQDPYANDNGYAGPNAVGGTYGRPPPRRQHTGDSNRPFPPQQQRQYSNDTGRPQNQGRGYSDRPYQGDNYQQNGPSRGPPSRGPGPGRMASPPLNNNSGFDFGTGAQDQYSQRPAPPSQQMSYGSSYNGSTAPPSYASRSQPPPDTSYRPYQAAPSQRRGPPPNLVPGGGRGDRQPENWDPVQR